MKIIVFLKTFPIFRDPTQWKNQFCQAYPTDFFRNVLTKTLIFEKYTGNISFTKIFFEKFGMSLEKQRKSLFRLWILFKKNKKNKKNKKKGFQKSLAAWPASQATS